jgi:hypothetical protein
VATQLKFYDSNPDWWGAQLHYFRLVGLPRVAQRPETAPKTHTNVSIVAQGDAVIQSVSRSPSSQTVRQSFSKSVSQPVRATHVAARLLDHGLIHSQAHCNSKCNSHCLSLCHSHQSHGESASQPASQTVGQSTNQPTSQPNSRQPQQSFNHTHHAMQPRSMYLSHPLELSVTPLATLSISPNSLCHCAFTHSRSTSHVHSTLRLAVSHASDATASYVAPSTYATLSFCALRPPVLSYDCYLTPFLSRTFSRSR